MLTGLLSKVDLRGVSIEELNTRWMDLIPYGRKEIIAHSLSPIREEDYYFGGNQMMYVTLAILAEDERLTKEEYQGVIDILTRHTSVSGLHYAREYNSSQ